MSGRRLAGSWLVGVGLGAITLAGLRGDLAGVAFPVLLGAGGFLLLTHAGQGSRRFPDTDLERGLDRLFALLLPVHAQAGNEPGIAIAQQRHLARLRSGARRWANELQLITTDGYQDDLAHRIGRGRRASGTSRRSPRRR